MLGLKGATSFYTCVWCKVHKDKKNGVVLLDHHSTEQWRKISIEKIEQKQQWMG